MSCVFALKLAFWNYMLLVISKNCLWQVPFEVDLDTSKLPMAPDVSC